jgi:hypothetical protein
MISYNLVDLIFLLPIIKQHKTIYNRYSLENFIELALILFFKRQKLRKLSWLDKDQTQFDELFN